MLDLDCRARVASTPKQDAIQGMIKYFTPSKPKDGSIPKLKVNSMISSRASQKLGMDTPSREMKIESRSMAVF
jgi:hypothetical protein